MRRVSIMLVAVPWVVACARGAPPNRAADDDSVAPAALVQPAGPSLRAAPATPDTAPTRAEFRNVDFHVGSGTVLRIRFLRGQMRSKRPGQPIDFDDKRSFVIDIMSAEVGLTMADLDHLMNEYVFAYRGAPLRNLRFDTRGEQLVQRGTLHKVVDIPFEITAAMSVTPAGRIRIHPKAIRIFDVDGEGLMKSLGITLERLLDVSQAKGVAVQGNDLLLDPDSLLPPPAITGRVTEVRIAAGQVIQVFGDTSAWVSSHLHRLAPLDSTAPNYMRFQGGTLRFGKLFMVQSDMEIIDAEPADPFDFSIDEYNRQLVAGYSRNTPAKGLKVYMPDLSKVGRQQLSPVHPSHR
jgi:hypothetical protein